MPHDDEASVRRFVDDVKVAFVNAERCSAYRFQPDVSPPRRRAAQPGSPPQPLTELRRCRMCATRPSTFFYCSPTSRGEITSRGPMRATSSSRCAAPRHPPFPQRAPVCRAAAALPPQPPRPVRVGPDLWPLAVRRSWLIRSSKRTRRGATRWRSTARRGWASAPRLCHRPTHTHPLPLSSLSWPDLPISRGGTSGA